MPNFDPFADAPEDEPATNVGYEPPAAPNERPAPTGDAETVTTTLKGGAGFEAPWIVTRAASVAEANALLDQAMADYMARVQKVAAKFVEYGGGTTAGAAQPRPSRQAPPDGAPDCPPGWVYKTGISKKTGKTWQAFMPPQGVDEKPIFF